MKNIFYLSALVVVLLNFSSCKKDDGDDFSGPTAQALNETFGTGFEDETLRDVSIDKNGTIYVSSRTKIYKLDANGNATVFAGSNTASVTDGQGTAATFKNIDLLSFDNAGNIYTIDYQVIRKISPGGTVTSLVNDGSFPLLFKDFEELPPYQQPLFTGLAVVEDAIYASSQGFIVKIKGTAYSIFAGFEAGFVDGQGNNAKFQYIRTVIADASGNNVLVTDRGSIRKVSLADIVVTTITGSDQYGKKDGKLNEASYPWINDMVIDKDGNYYLATFDTVRKISTDGLVSTIAGPIKSDGSSFQGGGIAVDANARYLYVTDLNKKATLIRIDLSK